MVLAVKSILLLHLEVNEIENFHLGVGVQALVEPHRLRVTVLIRASDLLMEELRDVHLEYREDLEQGFQADLVLAILHPAQIRLLDADATGEIGLG
jgi:hypothetical protein